MKKRMTSILTCALLTAAAVSGCAGGTDSGSGTGGAQDDKVLTVDVFDTLANYQGIQSGWFGKYVKDNFALELNIIAPNVAGGGDTLFQTRSAAGNLGDLVIIGGGGTFPNTVKAGLLYDMSDALEGTNLLKEYGEAIRAANEQAEEEGIWGIPSQISSEKPDTPMEGLDLTFGPYLRWDIYKEAGYPEMNTLEDLLSVLKQMQDTYPQLETGEKVYSFSFFKDWDGNMMNNAKQPICFYGYDELGFLMVSADDTDMQSIIDDDSYYVRVLKMFFDANQMGLVDPESTTQNYDTLDSKYRKGQVLYAPWPWLGQTAFNTPENKDAAKGYMLAPIKDMKIFSYGNTPNGNSKTVIGVGSKASQPERLTAFIDWLYSPEGYAINVCGPEGLTWEMDGERPVLTEFGKSALPSNDVTVPEEWGTGTWKDGVSALNFSTRNPVDINPLNNATYTHTMWDSVLEEETTALDEDWRGHMGARTTLEYLEQNDMYIVAPGSGYAQPEEDSKIATLRNQCKEVIVDNSWKMIFAKDEAEFYQLLSDMQKTVRGLGYDDVLDADMKYAQEQKEARAAVMEQAYGG